jgi:branched-chain amino acid transport system ATP-binding protein
MEREPVLSVHSISAHYGSICALRSVSLEVKQGEIVCLIGGNGAGKTTTLMCISGIVHYAAGEILYRGRSIQSTTPHALVAEGLSHVPEGRRIFSRLTVAENLELGRYLRRPGREAEEDRERVFDLFPILKDRRSQLGGTLSGGEQQMLAIGRALMNRPRLLILDEPSMGIAPILVERIFDTLKRLNSEGMTILLVEQNAKAALELAHRGYVLEVGSTTHTDSAAALLSDSRVKSAYLGD